MSKEYWLLLIVIMFILLTNLYIKGGCSVNLFAFIFNLNSVISVIREED